MKKVILEALEVVVFVALIAIGIYYLEIQKGISRLIWGGPIALVFFFRLIWHKRFSSVQVWVKRSYFMFLVGFFFAILVQYLYLFNVIKNYGYWLSVVMLIPFIGCSLYGSIKYRDITCNE